MRRWAEICGHALGLDVSLHDSIEDAVSQLREDSRTYILASDLSVGAVDINTIDMNTTDAPDVRVTEINASSLTSDRLDDAGKPMKRVQISNTARVVIAMGSEHSGISAELRSMADCRFYLPMYGFAESFNVAISVAITLAILESRCALQHYCH